MFPQRLLSPNDRWITFGGRQHKDYIKAGQMPMPRQMRFKQNRLYRPTKPSIVPQSLDDVKFIPVKDITSIVPQITSVPAVCDCPEVSITDSFISKILDEPKDPLSLTRIVVLPGPLSNHDGSPITKGPVPICYGLTTAERIPMNSNPHTIVKG